MPDDPETPQELKNTIEYFLSVQYRAARDCAVAQQADDPTLSPVPKYNSDPHKGIAAILAWCAKAAESSPSAPDCSKRRADTNETSATMGLEARAIAVLYEHPGWSNTKIAEILHCHPKSLSRFAGLKTARGALKQMGKLVRGSKDGKTGTMEAW